MNDKRHKKIVLFSVAFFFYIYFIRLAEIKKVKKENNCDAYKALTFTAATFSFNFLFHFTYKIFSSSLFSTQTKISISLIAIGQAERIISLLGKLHKFVVLNYIWNLRHAVFTEGNNLHFTQRPNYFHSFCL